MGCDFFKKRKIKVRQRTRYRQKTISFAQNLSLDKTPILSWEMVLIFWSGHETNRNCVWGEKKQTQSVIFAWLLLEAVVWFIFFPFLPLHFHFVSIYTRELLSAVRIRGMPAHPSLCQVSRILCFWATLDNLLWKIVWLPNYWWWSGGASV